MIYFIMVVISILFAKVAEMYKYDRIIGCKNKKIEYLIFFFLSLFPFVFVSGFRYFTGTDYATYLMTNSYIGSVFWGNGDCKTEFIFKIIVLIGYYFYNYQLVFFISSFIFSYCIFKYIYKYSNNICFSIIIFFLSGVYSYSLNIIRQMIAAAIMFYAFKFIIKRKAFYYFVFIFIACGFHNTAIIFIPLYFLSDIKLKKKISIPIYLLVFVICNMYQEVIRDFLSNIEFYSNYWGSRFEYSSSTVLFILNGLVIFFAIFFDKKDNRLNNLLFNSQLVLLFILVLQIPNSTRMAYALMPAQIVYLPNIIKQINIPILRKTISVIITMGYLVFFVYFFCISNIGETFPYRSIFFK